MLPTDRIAMSDAVMAELLRTALLQAGASPDRADSAAKQAATYETRLSGLETRISVLTCMVGANGGLTILVLGGFITLSSKPDEIAGQLTDVARAIK